mgnify:CR=1 FL=1
MATPGGRLQQLLEGHRSLELAFEQEDGPRDEGEAFLVDVDGFEGPLDALCVPNAIAMCGADLMTGLDRTRDAGYILTSPVLVWDNEPRSSPILQHLARAITQGHRVVIWPRHLPKDANEMVAQGIDVAKVLAASTFQGLRAQLEFHRWRV